LAEHVNNSTYIVMTKYILFFICKVDFCALIEIKHHTNIHLSTYLMTTSNETVGDMVNRNSDINRKNYSNTFVVIYYQIETMQISVTENRYDSSRHLYM
jgi:ferric iron reductase protein FhuF